MRIRPKIIKSSSKDHQASKNSTIPKLSLAKSLEINDEFSKKKRHHRTERSFHVGENKFSPRWSRSWWTKPPSFPVSYSPSSQEAAPVAFERCTARKSSRGWLEKGASFQVFPLGAYFPRPRIASLEPAS